MWSLNVKVVWKLCQTDDLYLIQGLEGKGEKQEDSTWTES